MNLISLQLFGIFSSILFICWALPYIFQKHKEKMAQKDYEREKIEYEKNIEIQRLKDELNKSKYIQKDFLTNNERDFFHSLVSSRIITSQFNIHPQVAMGAIIEARNDNDRENFDKKIIDFLVCDKKSKKIYCVIELDGKEHLDKEISDFERDKLLLSAGIKTIRYKNNQKLNPQTIKNDIISLYKGG